MKFKYGEYEHELDEAGLSISVQQKYSPRLQRQASVHSWSVNGVLYGSSATDLNSKIATLNDAYSQDGYDAVLLFSDGSETNHKLVSDGAIGGVRVVSGPSYPVGDGVEFATQRTYQIQLEAEFLNQAIGLISWQESLAFSGDGGPTRVYLPTLTGPPVEQIGQQQTTYRATQSGSAVGLFSRPVAANPIWPSFEHRPLRRITNTTPVVKGNGTTEYGISWEYVFESVSPLVGEPTIQ